MGTTRYKRLSKEAKVVSPSDDTKIVSNENELKVESGTFGRKIYLTLPFLRL